jgi:hypothetical protein
MELKNLILKVLIFLSATSSCGANIDRTSLFRVPRKGDQFIYRGILTWKVLHKPRQKEMTWVVEVVDVIRRGNYYIAELKGFPSDLMGLEPDGNDPKPKDYYYIVNKRGQTVCIADFLPSLNQRELKQWNGSLIYLNLAESPRGKRLYLDWVLESKKLVSINEIRGIRRKKYVRYTFGSRTLSDSEIIEFSPEIGVIEYKYVHYGTMPEVNMKLKEIKPSK